MTIDLLIKAKKARLRNGVTLQNIADDLNYSKENIRLFECGCNNNATILLYYINKLGLEVTDEG